MRVPLSTVFSAGTPHYGLEGVMVLGSGAILQRSDAASPYMRAERGAPHHNASWTRRCCNSNIEMTPLCKVEVTLPRVLGSRRMRRGGGVDEQAGVQPA